MAAGTWFILYSSSESGENPLRFPNGTLLKSKTYELNLGDMDGVFIAEGNIYKIASFNDSLLLRTDTIIYRAPEKYKLESLFNGVDQEVVNSRDRSISELYMFKNKCVYLLGYITAGDKESYTTFNPPIIILPSPDKKLDSTISVMKIISNDTSEVNVKSNVELKSTGKILINNIVDKYFLYELTITGDTGINYGRQKLVMPGAVLFKSRLLYSKEYGLIAEWGIRTKQKTNEAKTGKPDIYLEFNQYQTITL